MDAEIPHSVTEDFWRDEKLAAPLAFVHMTLDIVRLRQKSENKMAFKSFLQLK
jgi:hypothetical protein